MPSLNDAEDVAFALLGDTRDLPVRRAQRISAIYAACFLDEPLLGAWFGLGSYVARQVYYALEGPALAWRDLLGQGNLEVYRGILPAWLLHRAGHPVPGPLSGAFNELARAELALRERAPGAGAAADAFAEQALFELCDVEQRVIVQPVYDAVPRASREPLRALFRFRLGLSPAAPVLAWDNRFGAPWEADARCAWMTATVLPAWRTARAEHAMVLRAEADRTRRWGAVTLAELEAAVARLATR